MTWKIKVKFSVKFDTSDLSFITSNPETSFTKEQHTHITLSSHPVLPVASSGLQQWPCSFVLDIAKLLSNV
jgi:hypothetical protein